MVTFNEGSCGVSDFWRPGTDANKRGNSRKMGRRSFTLVEILGIAAIIAIIVYLVVVGYNGVYRSWATRNTVGVMKNVHLVLDKFRQEYGYFPVKSTSWEHPVNCYDGYPFELCFYEGEGASGDYQKTFRYDPTGAKGDPNYWPLVQQLVQQVHPYAKEFTFKNGGSVYKVFKVFDDFGSKTDEDNIRPLFYAYPYLTTGTCALFSKGKDGAWGGGDDIIYLPAGLESRNLRPGFYLVTLNSSGVIQGTADDIEPLAQ